MPDIKGNIQRLYNGLKSEGANDLGTLEEFTSKLQDEGNRRKVYDVVTRKLGHNVGDYNKFSSYIYEDNVKANTQQKLEAKPVDAAVGKPQQASAAVQQPQTAPQQPVAKQQPQQKAATVQAQQPQQPKEHPMTEADKARMNEFMDEFKGDARATLARTKNTSDWIEGISKRKPWDVGNVNIGTDLLANGQKRNKNVVQKGGKYITQSGNAYNTAEEANEEQEEIDWQNSNAAKVAKMQKELEGLDKEIEKEKKHVSEEYAAKNGIKLPDFLQKFRNAHQEERKDTPLTVSMSTTSPRLQQLQKRQQELRNSIANLQRPGVRASVERMNEDLTAKIGKAYEAAGNKYRESGREGFDKWLAPMGGESTAYGGGIQDAYNHDYDVQILESARRSIKNAQNLINEADINAKNGTLTDWLNRSFAGGAARGLGQSAFDLRTWDFGLNDAVEAKNLLNILKKADNGQKLTANEQALLDAKATEAATLAYFGNEVGRGYKAGQVTGMSLPFMVQIAVHPAAALGKTSQGMMMRYMVKRFGTAALKRSLASRMLTLGAKGAARLGGDIAASALITSTSGAGNVTAETMQRMAGNTQYNFTDKELKHIGYSGTKDREDATSAAVKSFVNNVLENFTEMGHVDVAGKWVKKGLAKITPKSLEKGLERFTQNDFAKALKELGQRTQFHGTIGEYLEEKEGDALRLILGTAEPGANWGTGKGGFFNLDENIDTFLGVGLMGGAFGVMGAAGYRTDRYNARKAVENAGNIADAVFADGERFDNWRQIRNTLSFGSDEEVKDVMRDVFGTDNYTDDERKAVAQYAGAAYKMRGIKIAEAKAKAEGDNLMSAYDEGRSLSTAEEMNDARNMYEYRRKQAAEAMGISEDELDAQTEQSTPEMYLRVAMQQGADKGKAVEKYINSKARFDGMIDGLRDNINDKANEAEDAIRQNTNRSMEDAQVVEATLADGTHGYIVSGVVDVTEDGKVNANGTADFMTMRTDDGKIIAVAPSDIETASVNYADALIEQARADIEEQESTAAEADIENGGLNVEQGAPVNFLDDSGQVVNAVSEGVTQTEDGQTIVSLNVNGQSIQMPLDALRGAVDRFNRTRAEQYARQEDATDIEQEGEGVQIEQGQTVTYVGADDTQYTATVMTEPDADGYVEIEVQLADGSKFVNRVKADELMQAATSIEGKPTTTAQTSEEEAQLPPPPTNMTVGEDGSLVEAQQPTEEQTRAIDRIPSHEANGTKVYDWEKAAPEDTYDALVETFGSMADKGVENSIKDIDKQLKAAEKALQKVEGMTIEQMMANPNAIADAQNLVNALNERKKYWESVKNVPTARAAQAEERKKKEAENALPPLPENVTVGEDGSLQAVDNNEEKAQEQITEQPQAVEESASEQTESEAAPEVAEEANETEEQVREAEAQTDTNPTEAQKEAGNYRKGHVTIDGLDISIEQPRGSVRSGKDKGGKEWSVVMNNTYGYIRGTEGVDGDHIDIFLSDNPTEGDVFVVDQVNEDGTFDEHKVMYGFPDIESAREAYLANYSEGWQGLGAITPVSKENFKKWIDSSHRKTKPFAEYSSVETIGDVLTEHTEEEQQTANKTKQNDSEGKQEEKKPQKPTSNRKNTEEQKERLYENGGIYIERETTEDDGAYEVYSLHNGDAVQYCVPDSADKRIADFKKPGEESVGTAYNAMGDYMFRSLEEAKEIAEKLRKRDAANAEYQKKVAEKEKAEAEKAEAEKERKRYGGFTDGKSPMQAANIAKVLDKVHNFTGYGTKAMYKHIEDWAKTDGVTFGVEHVPGKKTPEYYARMKDGSEFLIPKTAYDYATFVGGKMMSEADIERSKKDDELQSLKQRYSKYKDEAKRAERIARLEKALKGMNAPDLAKELADLRRLDELMGEAEQNTAKPSTQEKAEEKAKTSDSQEDEKKRTEKDKGKGKKNERKAEPMDIGKFVPYTPKVAEWVQNMPPMHNMLGVYHDPSGFAVASDGHILVYDKRQYDDSRKGQIVATRDIKKGREFTWKKKGETIEGRYPNWQRVIPEVENNGYRAVNIDFAGFAADFKKQKAQIIAEFKERNNLPENEDVYAVNLVMPDGRSVRVDNKLLQDYLDAADSLGATSLYYGNDYRKPLFVKSENGGALLMPMMGTNDAPVIDLSKYVTAENSESKQEDAASEPTAVESKGKKPTAVKGEKIEDVGERLEGARKDMLKVLSKTFEDATVQALIELPFSKAFKKPDLKKAVESGALREEDALFYETLFALINTNKPKDTKSELWKKKKYENYETSVEKWAKQTHNILSFLKEFVEATPEQRDIMMRTMMENHYPGRDKELAEIEKRKELNKDYTYTDKDGKEHTKKYEWGDKTTPNMVWVMHEILSRLGYEVGDKMDIPYGVIKASADGLYYGLTDNKNDKNYAIGTFASIEGAIDAAVYLAKVKRGDTDLQHPKKLFSVVHTKTTYKDSGKYRVVYGRNLNVKQFDSKEEADKFVKEKAARAISAYASPIQEVDEMTDYVITFYHPLTGKKIQIDNEKFATKAETLTYLSENIESVNEAVNEKLRAEAEQKGQKKEITADDMMHVSYTYNVANKTASYAVYMNKEVANNYGMPAMLREGFQSREEAKQWLEEHKTEVFDIYKKAEAQRKAYVYFSSGQDTRAGEDYRNGKDVTAEDFMNEFGFRGVQFGNWTNQTDRQMAINQAYDALIDMAHLLGVSPKALSLGGKLGIAFGSRGSGNANAHFERDEFVINLTKTRGAGSLAHEWWHALDSYFAKQAGMELGMVTEQTSLEMRKELREAYNNLVDAIKETDYYERSRKSGSYWGSIVEVTARLFAEWVDRELKKRGELNTFLSRGADEERWQQMMYDVHRATATVSGKEPMTFDEFKQTKESLRGYPYPSTAEVEELGDAVRNIFDTVQERIDEESGAVALFHKAEGTAEGVSERDAAVRDAIVDIMRGAGIEVVTDTEEAQRILDLANGEVNEHRVYHGTGADFDAFDHSHMGEGEGAQAYGWGTYVTEVEGIGRGYAKRVTDLKASEREFIKGKIEEARKYNIPAQVEYWENELKNLGDAQHYLYEVEIPEDNGRNYIDWKAPLTKENKEDIRAGLLKDNFFRGQEQMTYDDLKSRGHDVPGFEEWLGLRADLLTTSYNGEDFYKGLSQELGGDEIASEFLKDCGFVGIKYPAEALSGGREDGAKNFVIFDENNAKIESKTRFFRTESGEAYGFVKDGKIYLDPRIAGTQTAVHEYTHLWAEALRQSEPEKWKEIADVLQNDKSVAPLMEQVKKNYPELSGDDLIDELLAHYSGKRGAERLNAAADEIEKQNGGVFGKAEAISAIENVKRVLNDFWKKVAELLGFEKKFKNADEVADMVLNDLLSGSAINTATDNKSGQMRFDFGDNENKRATEEDAANTLYSARELVKARQRINSIGNIGKAGTKAFESEDGKRIYNPTVAKNIGEYMVNALQEYKDWLEFYAEDSNATKAYKQRFADHIAEVDKAIEFYNELKDGKITDPNAIYDRDIRYREIGAPLNPRGERMTAQNTSLDEAIAIQGSGIRYSTRVNHNSPFLLKKADGSFVDAETGETLGFDHRFMGTGEGNQAHGWGSYFSVNDIREYAGSADVSDELEAVEDAEEKWKDEEQEAWIDTDIETREQFNIDLPIYLEDSYSIGDADPREVAEIAVEYFGEDRDKVFTDDENEDDNIYEINDRLLSAMDTEYRRKMFDKRSEFIDNYVKEHTQQPERHHYDVEIPDNDGTNYIEEGGEVDEKILGKVRAELQSRIDEDGMNADYMLEKMDDVDYMDGRLLYKMLSKYAFDGSDEKASKFLKECGIVGIHYDGRQDGECYVIFDESDAKIVNHERFRDGEAAQTEERDEDAMERDARAFADELGTRVRVVRDVNEIEHPDAATQNRMRESLGWFDPKSGEVVVVIPNNTDAADVRATVLHEIVGHKGLQQVVGKEKFEDFLMKVYRGVDVETRKKINEIAARNHWDFYEGIEEYIAQQAERGFEDRENAGLWRKIVQYVRDLLSEAKVRLGMNLGENDVRYMLWKTYQLKKGRRGVFAEARDVALQNELGVGNYRYSRNVFGGNSGYVGYSKSKRAVRAENAGLRNKSQMNKEFADEVNELIKATNPDAEKVTLKQIKDALGDIKADEWHHTSMYGNRTNYYSAETIAKYFTPESEEEKTARESKANRYEEARAAYYDLHNELEKAAYDAMPKNENGKFVSSDGYEVMAQRNMLDKPQNLYNAGIIKGNRYYSGEDLYFEHREDYDRLEKEYNEAWQKAHDGVLTEDKKERLQQLQKEMSEADIDRFRFRTSEELDRDYPNWNDTQTTSKGGHSTQITGTVSTYRKIGEMLKQNGMDGVSVLDASSGKGVGTEALRDMGFDVDDVEPYAPSDRKNAPTYDSYDKIDKKYDVIISNAVLNVIPDDWRADVLRNMAAHLADGGMMIVNTRGVDEAKGVKNKVELDDASEILISNGKGGFRSYQKFYNHETLAKFIKDTLGDGYVIEKATKANAGFANSNAVVVRKADTTNGGGIRFRDNGSNAAAHPDEADNTLRGVALEYNKRLGKGSYQAIEAIQDSMRSLLEVQRILEERSGKPLEDWENAYMAENAMSSRNNAEYEAWKRDNYKPLTEAVRALMESEGLSREGVEEYLYMKHGIERNREMSVRAAISEKAEREGKKAAHAEIRAQRDAAKQNGTDFKEPTDTERKRLEKQKEAEMQKQLRNDWKQKRDEIRKQYPNDWEKAQRELDKAATMVFGADLDAREYSGLTAIMSTDDVADARTRAYDAVKQLMEDRPQECKALDDAVHNAASITLEKPFRSGLIDRTTFDDISDMYEYYIPLRGFSETMAEEVYNYLRGDAGHGYSEPIKRAKGRMSQAESPLTYLVQMAQSALVQGNRNIMKQRFYNMAVRRPSDLITVSEAWVVKQLNPQTGAEEWVTAYPQIKPEMSADEVEKAVADFENDMMQREAQGEAFKTGSKKGDGIPYRTLHDQLAEHQVIVKRAGREYVLTVNGNPRLAQAVNGKTNPNSNYEGVGGKVKKALDDTNRKLSQLYTTANPDFVVSNLMRDTAYTWSMALIKEDATYAKSFIGHWNKNLPKMWSLYTKLQHNRLDMNDPVEREFKNFVMNGGETGYSTLQELEDIKAELDKDLAKGDVKKYVDRKLEAFDRLNRSVENLARFSAYLASRDAGRTVERSVYDAKEISVNFNKKGAGGMFFGTNGQTKIGNIASSMSAIGRGGYIFWNAGIQGMANISKIAKRNPKKFAAGAAVGFALGFILAAMHGDDDDDELGYGDLPDYVRRSNIVIGGGKHYFTAPLPVEYRTMYGMGELAQRVLSGNEKYTNAELAEKVAATITQALPIDPLEGMSGGGKWYSPLIPSYAKPLAEVAVNSDWTGKPIYYENEWNKRNPEWTKVNEKTTNSILFATSKMLNEWTGGDDFTSGALDINPAIVEHLAQGYLGGLMTFGNRVMKTGETLVGARDYDSRNIPVANRIYKQPTEYTKDSRINSEYRKDVEDMRDLKQKERGYRQKAAEGNAEYAEKYRELVRSREYRKMLRFENLYKQVKKLNDDAGGDERAMKQVKRLKKDAVRVMDNEN